MEDGEKRKPIKVQVNITNSIKKDYHEFEGGDIGTLICITCIHEMLITDLKLQKNIATYSSLLAGKIATKNGNPIQYEKEQLKDQIPS